MDERQLRILRELGELGSVRAVAEALHITPSAISQQLKLLQRTVAVPLTERRGRYLRLTEAGEALAAAGAEVHTALARARQVAHDLGGEPSGTVTLSAFNSAALALFPPLLRAFPGTGPVQIHVTDEDVAQEDFPRLTSRIDIVIAHRLDHTPAWPATVTVTPLLHEPLDVALPRSHPLCERGRLHPADVAGEPWITTHDGFPIIASLEAVGAIAGRPLTFTHRVNEFSVAIELVKAGGGLALVPRWTVPRPRGVVLRPLEGLAATRHIDALHRPEQRVRPSTQTVLAKLRRVASALGEP